MEMFYICCVQYAAISCMSIEHLKCGETEEIFNLNSQCGYWLCSIAQHSVRYLMSDPEKLSQLTFSLAENKCSFPHSFTDNVLLVNLICKDRGNCFLIYISLNAQVKQFFMFSVVLLLTVLFLCQFFYQRVNLLFSE